MTSLIGTCNSLKINKELRGQLCAKDELIKLFTYIQSITINVRSDA